MTRWKRRNSLLRSTMDSVRTSLMVRRRAMGNPTRKKRAAHPRSAQLRLLMTCGTEGRLTMTGQGWSLVPKRPPKMQLLRLSLKLCTQPNSWSCDVQAIPTTTIYQYRMKQQQSRQQQPGIARNSKEQQRNSIKTIEDKGTKDYPIILPYLTSYPSSLLFIFMLSSLYALLSFLTHTIPHSHPQFVLQSVNCGQQILVSSLQLHILLLQLPNPLEVLLVSHLVLNGDVCPLLLDVRHTLLQPMQVTDPPLPLTGCQIILDALQSELLEQVFPFSGYSALTVLPGLLLLVPEQLGLVQLLSDLFSEKMFLFQHVVNHSLYAFLIVTTAVEILAFIDVLCPFPQQSQVVLLLNSSRLVPLELLLELLLVGLQLHVLQGDLQLQGPAVLDNPLHISLLAFVITLHLHTVPSILCTDRSNFHTGRKFVYSLKEGVLFELQ